MGLFALLLSSLASFEPDLEVWVKMHRAGGREEDEAVEKALGWECIKPGHVAGRGGENESPGGWLTTESQTSPKLLEWLRFQLPSYLLGMSGGGGLPKHPIPSSNIILNLGVATTEDPALFSSPHLSTSENVLCISRLTNSFSVQPCQAHWCFSGCRALPAPQEAPAE